MEEAGGAACRSPCEILPLPFEGASSEPNVVTATIGAIGAVESANVTTPQTAATATNSQRSVSRRPSHLSRLSYMVFFCRAVAGQRV